MPLKAIKPTQINKRLKMLLFGDAGSGKTTASIQFPRPLIIDTERGCEHDSYAALLQKQEGAILQSSDFDDIIREVKTLLTEKHDYKTLIIDPITLLYDQLLQQAERKVSSDFGRHYTQANKTIRQLLNLILRLDMNVIFTAHTKNEYGDKMNVIGAIADGYKKLPYFFDLVLEIKKQQKNRIAIVKKSRIKSLEALEQFPFSYDTLAQKYGRETLERDAAPEALATPDQISELKQLIKLGDVSEDSMIKTLEKAGATTFDELSLDKATLWIAHLKQKNKQGEQR